MTRLLLGQLAPVPGDTTRNLERIAGVVRSSPSDLAIFPELFLSGYRVGDAFHRLALRPGDLHWKEALRIAHETGTTLVLGTPVASPERKGELENAVLAFSPSGSVGIQVKRYLPNFGPFEEGVPFTPTDVSRPVPFGSHQLGLLICYDTFFPEVARSLALGGADLLIVVSASPVTSGPLFEKLLPARAIENGLPAVYVNRVGVEDGIVFGGGSGVWDPRGEPTPLDAVPDRTLAPEERVLRAEIDLTESARWRPFRPVLRDVATRPGEPPRN
ncbi:MAG: carbon-nitrogen hydrolase family protein [Thermoplasmata archaeon]